MYHKGISCAGIVYTYYPLLMCSGPLLSCNIYTAEDYFTERAMGDVKALKENNPESALVLDEFDTANPPHLSSLPYKQRPLAEVTVGSYVLVKAGEVCCHSHSNFSQNFFMSGTTKSV
jgi:hypothetical protein